MVTVGAAGATALAAPLTVLLYAPAAPSTFRARTL